MRVVVGIDGSPESGAALRFALEEAALRGLPLRVVYAWEPPAGAYVGEVFAATDDALADGEVHAEGILRDALGALTPPTAVAIEALSIEGPAATVLAEQAEGATLLVVGSRGRGATKSLLLGSVGQALAHHAPCPLTIVRHA